MKKIRIWSFFLVCTILFLSIVEVNHWIKTPCKKFFIDPICSFERNDKELILTFDDGPGPATSALLSTLKSLDVKVIFFVNGERLKLYPEIAKQSVEEGHILANHSYKHESMIFKSFEYIENDMLQTDSLIRLTGQQKVNLYRPPFGRSFFNLPKVLKKHNKIMFNWSICPSAQFALTYSRENFINQTLEQLHEGGIILLHDGWDNLKSTTLIDIAENVIEVSRCEGYKFVLP